MVFFCDLQRFRNHRIIDIKGKENLTIQKNRRI